MCTGFGKSFLTLAALAVILSGCAGSRVQSTAPMASGGSIILVEAHNYSFVPNEIKVGEPGLLALEIRNMTGSKHNFTIMDPRGKTIKSIDIRSHASSIFNLDLTEPGSYPFYCNKFLHSTLGMKGRIVVAPAG